MKKWLPLLILFLLLAGSLWLWSLGSMPRTEVSQATLENIRGDVQVRSSGDDTWKPATEGQALAEGEQVKTGADGFGVLRFFDTAETRLDHDANVTVRKLSVGADGSQTEVALHLEMGRVWSRVLRLLDVESGFSVETNDTVATVRGTSFDVQKHLGSATTTVWVSQSVVDLTDPAAKETENAGMIIPDGYMFEFGKGARGTSTQMIAEAVRKGEWFTTNAAADLDLDAGASQRLRDRLSARKSASTEGVVAVLRDFSESLHVRLQSGDAGRALRARYLLRRLVALRDLAENGRSGAAYEQYNRLESQVRGLLEQSSSHAAYRLLGQGTMLFADVSSDSPAYRLKQKWEDLGIELADTQAEKLYRRLVGVDARLDEAASLLDQKRMEEALGLLDVSRQALQNSDRDRKDAETSFSFPVRVTVVRKLRALVVRERALRDRLAVLTAPAPIQGPALPVLPVVTSTAPVPPPKTTTTTTPIAPPPSGTVSCVAITITAQPNPVDVGSRTFLAVTARRADSSTFNATSLATFRIFGNLGTLLKNVFTASAAGSVGVEATVMCDGKPVVSQSSIQINAGPIKVRTLALSGTPTMILPLERVGLTAMATYENGVTSMVTNQASYQTSDPTVGTVVGGVFVAGQTPGVTTVTATYVENGVTVQAFLTFTVYQKLQ